MLDTANNVNKTCVLLQTSGGKDEPNIVFMWTSQHGTQNVKTHNRTTLKTIKMSDTDSTKTQEQKNQLLQEISLEANRSVDPELEQTEVFCLSVVIMF